MGDWFETRIGDQVELQRGFDITKAEQKHGQVPVVSSGGVSSHHDQACVAGPGVVLGRKGTVGTVFFLPGDFWPHDTTLWVKNFKGNDPRFVYYFFLSIADTLRTLDHGTANPTLNRNHLHPTHVRWVAGDEQREVAGLLGSLDDKLANNLKASDALERFTRAVFRSWFVDFDPVTAKSEGRQPFGMNAETAALFPSRFVESELGPIPEGWFVDAIGSQVRVVGGSTPSTAKNAFWEGGTHFWITPRDLSKATSKVVIRTDRRITDAGLEQISSGLLPRGTVLLSSRAPIGYLALTDIELAINQGFIAMVCSGTLTNHFTLLWCEASMEEILGRAGGTTFAEISKTNFRPIPVVVPAAGVTQRFSEQIGPMFELIAANLRESATLAQLRDALLPKLMSGEIRLKQAEKAVEAAV